MTSRTFAHPLRRLLPGGGPGFASLPFGWKAAGAAALLCSTVAWASLPALDEGADAGLPQVQTMAGAPLANAAAAGMVAPSAPVAASQAELPPVEVTGSPVRIKGQAGSEGLYWALREAGASPQVTADYLAALATTIDVGEVNVGDTFDLVLGKGNQLLYAGVDRFGDGPVQLVKWSASGRSQWINPATAASGQATQSGLVMPVAGHITSYFGYRYHPILHFSRFHAGLDIGAVWGSPIVAAADGQVVGAGWAGGYGRQVQVAHGGGYVSTYSHMSEIAAAPGTMVRAGQVIGYVGSSGLSTGPHLHFEVRRGGTPVNPLGVRFASAPVADPRLAAAVKARLKALLAVGTKQA